MSPSEELALLRSVLTNIAAVWGISYHDAVRLFSGADSQGKEVPLGLLDDSPQNQ